MPLVASVNYATKRIYLSADTVGASIDTVDVYKEVRALRRTTEAHRAFKPIIIAGGNVEKIPGVSATPAYVQLLYGCRIIPYNTSHSLRLIRDTFTDDGFAGRDCFDRTPLSASVVVDIDVDIAEVEIRYISTGDAATIGVVQAALIGLGYTSSRATKIDTVTVTDGKVDELLQIEKNTRITDGTAGTFKILDDDDSTVLLSGPLFEDSAGTQPYRGQGAERRGKLT